MSEPVLQGRDGGVQTGFTVYGWELERSACVWEWELEIRKGGKKMLWYLFSAKHSARQISLYVLTVHGGGV